MRRLNLARFSAAFVLLLLSTLNNATAGTGTGSVVGVIRGPGGVGLPGATVTVSADDTDAEIKVVTSENGNFRIDNLEPG